MLGIILGALFVLGILAAVAVSISITPKKMRWIYGGVFWTSVRIVIVAWIGSAVIGLL